MGEVESAGPKKENGHTIIAAGAVLAIFGASAAVGYEVGKRDFTDLAVGEVTCAGNLAVVGAWIETGFGSGNAMRFPGPSSATEVYAKFVPPGLYSVHVGCGGTSGDWEWKDYYKGPGLQTNTAVSVTCSPTSDDPETHGICLSP